MTLLPSIRSVRKGGRRFSAAVPALLHNESLLQPALVALLVLCIVRCWVMSLPSSFWVDEMATVFVVRQGADHPSLRVAPQVPASLYYRLPQLTDRLFGLSEVAYRIPSALALGAALLLIARLAAAMVHPDAAWFAAFACLALRDFNYEAADARPYALGTFVLCACLWCLVCWFDRGSRRYAFLFLCCASALWRIHLIFWPLYLMFGAYAAARLLRRDTKVRRWEAAAVAALLAISLLPVLQQALRLNSEAAAHVIVRPPSGTELVSYLKAGFVAGVFAVTAFLAWRLRWPRVDRPLSPDSLSLILSWWLCHPLALFVFSWATGHSVFVGRYLAIALPGVGLMAAAGASLYLPPRYWKRSAAFLGIGVFLLLGRWNHLFPPHHNSDWRAAAAQLGKLSTGPAMPVLCPSPFIEASPPVWKPQYSLPGFLYSHLSVYDIHGKPYLLPFQSNPEAEGYVSSLAREVLSRSTRFAIYGPESTVLFWRDRLAAQPSLTGWSNRRLGPFGDVEVVVFEAAG